MPPAAPPLAHAGDAGHLLMADGGSRPVAGGRPTRPEERLLPRVILTPAAAECRRLRSALVALLPDIHVLTAQVEDAMRGASSPDDAARLGRLATGTLHPLLASLRRPPTPAAYDAVLLRRAARVLPAFLRERRAVSRAPAPFDAQARSAAAAA